MTRETVGFTFECGECAEVLEVNGSMKATLIEMGCVICGADVAKTAFTSIVSVDPPDSP